MDDNVIDVSEVIMALLVIDRPRFIWVAPWQIGKAFILLSARVKQPPSALQLRMSTDCILGFASSEWKRQNGEWYDTHIGGAAVWPHNLRVHIPPCALCRRHRTLVLQAYAPHSAHQQREIYLYGCNSVRCSGHAQSWYALRVVKSDEARNGPDSSSASGTFSKLDQQPLQRDNINWDSDSSSDSSPSDAATLVQELEQLSLALNKHDNTHITNKHVIKNTPASALPALPRSDLETENVLQPSSIPFASYYIEVEKEPGPQQCDEHEEQINRLLSKYHEEEKLRSTKGISEQWAPEPDEEEKPEVVALQIFSETVARAPEQILRYHFGGEPLWPRYPPPITEKKSCQCGAPLLFELQLLASCIHYLRPDDALPPEEKEAGMDFASVAIYTCANDCEHADDVIDNASFKAFEQEISVQRDDW